MIQIKLKLVVLFIVVFVVSKVENKCLFAALSSMMNAVRDEHQLLKLVENYVKIRTDKLDMVQRSIDKWKMVNAEMRTNLTHQRPNRLQKFKITKRLAIDWNTMKEKLVNKTQDLREIADFHRDASIANHRDVKGFARLLVLNTRIYDIPVNQILDKRDKYFKISDLLDLSFFIRYYDLGETMQETFIKSAEVAIYALKLLDVDSPQIKLENEGWDHMSNLSDVLYNKGSWDLGLQLTKEISRLYPNDDEFLMKSQMFADRISDGSGVPEEAINGLMDHLLYGNYDVKIYHDLCRRKELYLLTKADVYCFYHHKNPFLRKIAPFKIEKLYANPDVFLIYDVLHNGEIETMKQYAYPLLTHAKVFIPNNPEVSEDISDDRISNNAWLQPFNFGENYWKLLQRMEDSTGLAKEGGEGLQVNNYGIGGHYLYHYDALYYNVENQQSYPNDRIATFMFYLNDVKDGGNTVFLRLNTSVPPIKGAALFWYNLHPSGKNDFRSLHAGCPILEGNKWVTNIWIREFDQIFTKKCDPSREFEQSDYYTSLA